MTDIGDGTNTFVVANVDGSPRTVLQFPQSNGLRLAPTTGIVPNDVYTIAVLFEFDTTTGYRRVMDFTDGASETTLFVVNGNLAFYDFNTGIIASGATPFAPNTYYQVVLTRNAAGIVTAYLDGVRQFSFDDSTAQRVVINGNNALRFFRLKRSAFPRFRWKTHRLDLRHRLKRHSERNGERVFQSTVV